ncbi:hypothetical protein WA026_019585 [Henosepilachna vigintioctopunctata]|uniref:Uncharacterized protein n=1 Tax=Henosepilachna vigintioctopunctata TaxID=420089 RepID=A0AAW1TMQ1_9CUCU
MTASGLKELLSTVYVDKTCDQILSGHNYSGAVRAHSLVQLSQELSEEDFKAYKQNHSARRSDKYFAKISTNQTIEQTLMKSMKIEGGPFRRGATPSVVFKCIKATLFKTDVIDGIEEFCRVPLESSYELK